jgi:chromosomal replication initiator protein
MVPELVVQNTDRPFPFPFPAESLSTDPSADEVVNNLLAALRATVALPPNPAIAGLAKRTLAEIARIQGAVDLGAISDFVAMRFRLAPDQLMGKSRIQRVAFARQVAMYLCRKITESSFPTIGEHFNRDHSTAIHSFNLISRRVESDLPFHRTIQRIEHELAVSSAPATAAAA